MRAAFSPRPPASISQDQMGAGRRQSAGREEKVEFKLPAGMQYEQRTDKSITAMLQLGRSRRRISARACRMRSWKAAARSRGCFRTIAPRRCVITKQTGMFPIMHVVAMRRAVFERYPWAAMNLLKAFTEAKDRSLERIARSDGFAHPAAVVA